MPVYGNNIIHEKAKSSDYKIISYFGKKMKINFIDEYNSKELIEANMDKVESAIKTFCKNKDLYKFMLGELAPRFYEGLDITPEELIDIIKNDKTNNKRGFGLFVCYIEDDPKKCIKVYICGEYSLDDEHGFSITFPDGKFMPSKNYTGEATYIGGYSDYL